MGRLKYNLNKDVVTFGEALDLIIRAMYSEEVDSTDSRRKVEKRVRSRISDAISKGKLRAIKKGATLKKGLNINAAEFFKWSVEVWDLKSEVDDLPIDYVVQAAVTPLVKRAKVVASSVTVPGDLEKLEREYMHSECERVRLEKENQLLKSKLSDSESRLYECEKDLISMKKRKIAINKKKGRRTV